MSIENICFCGEIGSIGLGERGYQVNIFLICP